MRAVASHGRNYSHLPRMIKSTMISPLRKDQGRKGKEHRQGGSPIFFFAKKNEGIPKKLDETRVSSHHFFGRIIGILHFFRAICSMVSGSSSGAGSSGGCLATPTAKRCRGWCNAARRAAKTTTTGGSEWQNRWRFFLWSKSRWISGTPKRHQP